MSALRPRNGVCIVIVLSPVVKNICQGIPDGSSIQDFSDFA